MPECQVAGSAVDAGIVTLGVQCPGIALGDQHILESSRPREALQEVLTVAGVLGVECDCAPHGGERCIVMTQDPLETGIAIQYRRASRRECHRAIDLASCATEVQESIHEYVPAEHHVRIGVVGSQRDCPFCRLTSLGVELAYGSGLGREEGHIPECPCSLRMCCRKARIERNGLIESSERPPSGGDVLRLHIDLPAAKISV